jgi:hypothetical protein
MMTMKQINEWALTAKKNETLLYYKGFFAEDAFYNPEMKEFSKHLLDFEKKSNSFILYQNKIKKVVNVKMIHQFMNIT